MVIKRSLVRVSYCKALSWIGVFCVFSALACSSVSNSHFSSLVNTGIVPVSSENPFMGSNIFLAKEMEDSNYLYNFMKEKGAPQAIEVHGTSERSAELQLFYSGKQEVYHATPQFDEALKTKEWIVRGPYNINRTEFRQIADLPSGHGGIFEIFGRREVLDGELRAAQTRVIAPAFVPTPKPPVRRVKKSGGTTSATTSPTFLGAPSNFDQQAIAEARGAAPAAASSQGSGPAIVINDSKPLGSLTNATAPVRLKTQTPSSQSNTIANTVENTVANTVANTPTAPER